MSAEYKDYPRNSQRTPGGLHTVSNDPIEHRCGINLQGNRGTQTEQKMQLEIQQKLNNKKTTTISICSFTLNS